MKTENKKAIAEIQQINDMWHVGIQRPGTTMITGKLFNTQDEAVKYANEFLAEYSPHKT